MAEDHLLTSEFDIVFTRCCILLLLSFPLQIALSQEQEARDELISLRTELVNQIHHTDHSEFSASDSFALYLAASQAFDKADMKELAGGYFQRAIQVARANDEEKYQFRLFDHALKIGDLETAAKIAENSNRKERFLDRVAVEKYRRGDDGALDGFPREGLDFYIALDLADAYAKRREYEKLETFVRGIDSLPSNEPTDVGAIIWRRIADDYRAQGNMAEAKAFIDKAMEIGGNNYYTGYSIRVTRLSIHGGLREEAKNYAELAVAYRGHHTRELLSSLLGELVEAGQFDVAKDTLQYYPTAEERMSAQRHLAYELARKGRFAEATKLAKAIEDRTKSASARIYVATQLIEAGKPEPAKVLIREAAELLAKQTDSSAEYYTCSLIQLLARMNERETVMEIIEAARSPLHKAQRSAAALEGISLRLNASKTE